MSLHTKLHVTLLKYFVFKTLRSRKKHLRSLVRSCKKAHLSRKIRLYILQLMIFAYLAYITVTCAIAVAMAVKPRYVKSTYTVHKMGTKWVKLTEFQSYVRILVVYVCASLLQLAVELGDLSQAETKNIAVKNWSNSQNDNYFH